MATAEARSSVGFLGLPPEIRNYIYRLALPAQEVVNVDHLAFGVSSGTKTFLSLMRVSRQLHAESAPMLYAHHTYEFTSAGGLISWLTSIQRMKEHVRNFTFNFRYFCPSIIMAELPWALHCLESTVHSLQEITILLQVGRMLSLKKLALICMPLLRAAKQADLNATSPRSLKDLVRICPFVYRKLLYGGTTEKAAGEYRVEFRAELEKLLAEG